MVSVLKQTSGNEHQLLGFKALDGTWLYKYRGRLAGNLMNYGLLMCRIDVEKIGFPLNQYGNHPSLMLWVRIEAREDKPNSISGTGQRSLTWEEENDIYKVFEAGVAAYLDFERTGNLESLEEAIVVFEGLLLITPESHPALHRIFNNIGAYIFRRFQQFGRLSDLNKAIARFEKAIDLLPDNHPERASRLSNLGACFQTRFEQFGNPADINSSITILQTAVNRLPENDPNKHRSLNNLGNSLQIRFRREGNLTDIDNAINHLQAAVNLVPAGHSDEPRYLTSLGICFRSRYGRLGNITDLENAIIHLQAAVNLFPDGHPDKHATHDGLGSCLGDRFRKFGNVADLNNSITHIQLAVNTARDGHPNKPVYLSNLGEFLETRFALLGNVNDIDDAIIQLRKAVSLTPDGHPEQTTRLNSLGASLGARSLWLNNPADLDDATTQLKAAVDLTPDGHLRKAGFLLSLGTVYTNKFIISNSLDDAKAAISHFSASAQSKTGSPSTSFEAARRWIDVASDIKHPSLLTAYECALGLMPLIAWLGLPITDRYQRLIRISEIARDAAATAISLGQYDKALEWLEQGRSIVWNQILQLRTPVDELRRVNSGLADRLVQVSRLIDRGAEQKGSTTESDAQRHRALTMEWESIIEQVRSLPNFENFLKPLQASRLMDATRNGPVIVLNVAKDRCDALALFPEVEEVIHIPLQDLTLKRVTELRDELKDHLYTNGIRLRGNRAARRWTEEGDSNGCRGILAELWNGVVKPVLDALTFWVRLNCPPTTGSLMILSQPHPTVLPRVWWCPTGSLAFLPIHAAGIYDQGSNCSQITDYVISSYAPTLSALLESSNSTANSKFKLLSVIQPSAPGVSQIPNTNKELEYIDLHLGDREHAVLHGREGTRQRVMKAMEDSNWIHLACHGVQRQDEPTKSALILEDGHLTLEEIIKLHLPSAEFAFLSACQTTTGEEKLSDEAVHIASGMLLAGYRGVVATMWSIQDDIAPEIADEFYRRIMAGKGRPDNQRVAEALHFAVQRIRKKGVPLTSWIPFVHLGV
jgi:tetratricopeptide (TPR) repeat protein